MAANIKSSLYVLLSFSLQLFEITTLVIQKSKQERSVYFYRR